MNSVEKWSENIPLEEVPTCPLCGSSNARPLQHITCFAFHRCTECGLVRLSPRLAEPELGSLYGAGYYPPFDSAEDPRLPMFASRAKTLEQLLPPGSARTFFEIGCGDGAFLTYLQRRGWQVSGAEFTPETVATIAEKQGVMIYQGSAEDLASRIPPQPVLGFYHVLEHTYHLHEFMQAVQQLVLPGGILHLQVPNLYSLEIMLTGKYARTWTTPQHTQMFTPATLERLLQHYSFRILHIHMFDPYYSPNSLRESFRRMRRGLFSGADDQQLLDYGFTAQIAYESRFSANNPEFSPPSLALRVLRTGMVWFSYWLARSAAVLQLGNVIDVVVQKTV